MNEPKKTKLEEERLKELYSYEILDTVEEEEYDFITKMAASICKCKISLISLVSDKKQWFKSHYGLEAKETDKSISFCAHAINEPEKVFIVNNAKEDERFFDNPLVTDYPFIHFYAGVPLVNNNGFALGTLCVINDKELTLSEDQIKSLKLLANQVINLLETKKQSKQLKEVNKKLEEATLLLNQAQKISKLGAWQLDIETGNTFWTDEVYNIYGVDKSFDHNKEEGLKFYHPDDQETLVKALNNCIEKEQPFNLTLRLFSTDKKLKWVNTSGQLWKEGDRKIKIIGTFQDVTIEKEKQIKLIRERNSFKNVLTATKAGTWQWNILTKEVSFNERWAEIIGYKLEELENKDEFIWEKITHPDDFALSQIKIKNHLERKSEYYTLEKRFKHKDGHWVWVLDRGQILEHDDMGNPKIMYGTLIDISRRKEVELKTKYREKIFKSLYDLSPIGIALNDLETGVFLDVNNKLLEPTGYTKKEFLAMSYFDITPIEYQQKEAIAIKSMKEIGYYEPFEKEHIRKDGSRYPVLLRGVVVKDIEGKDMIWSFIEDITERKKAENKISTVIKNLQSILDSSTLVSIISTDKNGIIKTFNKGAEKMLGYAAHELIDKKTPEIIHVKEEVEIYAKELSNEYNEEINGFETFVFKASKNIDDSREWNYIHKNGKLIPVLLSVTKIELDNEIIGYLGIASKIDKQKEVELKLHESKKHLASIIEGIPDMLFIINEDGVFLDYVSSYKTYVEKDEFLNKKYSDVLPSNTHREMSISLEKAVKTKKLVEFEYSLLVDGEIKHYVGRIKHFINEKYLLIISDITERKKSVEKLNSLLKVTESQNEKLQNFSHIVSHNLRSHSGGIFMLISLLKKEIDVLQNNETFSYLEKASHNLLETLQHLTQIVEINSDKNVDFKKINLKIIIEKNIQSLEGLIANSKIKIINEVDKNITIKGIPAYLDSIVLNFLTNAIKYRSLIRDSYVKLSTREEDELLVLEIEDNGLGIDMNSYGKQLFGMYKTFHNNPDSKGIGLFITKNQIEAMGGKITVESELNKGTIFKIFFPK